MKQELLITSDGSHTIYIPGMDEQYHSVNGAITESDYVYINKGYLFHKNNTPSVFEVGFGTGLNCLLTALQAEKQNRPTLYHSIDKYPLDIDLVRQLNYGQMISKHAQSIFEKIHSSPWNQIVSISEFFRFKKIKGDLKDFKTEHKHFDVIYFDAFGPDKQPQLWTSEIFGKIYSITSEKGVFVTYSAKGDVRRRLTAVGFAMERLPGPPGKIQMLRGIKTF